MRWTPGKKYTLRPVWSRWCAQREWKVRRGSTPFVAPQPWGNVRTWKGEGTGTGGERSKGYAVDGEEKDCAAMCRKPVMCPAHVEKSAVPRLKFGRFLCGAPAPSLAPGRRPPLPPRLLARAAARGADLDPGVE